MITRELRAGNGKEVQTVTQGHTLSRRRGQAGAGAVTQCARAAGPAAAGNRPGFGVGHTELGRCHFCCFLTVDLGHVPPLPRCLLTCKVRMSTYSLGVRKAPCGDVGSACGALSACRLPPRPSSNFQL